MYTQNNNFGPNIMNFGSQPRELNSTLESQLKEMIPSGSSVDVTSVLGDGEAYNFASQIMNYLKKVGYKVDGVNQALFSGPVSGQNIEKPQNSSDSFKVIIGNNQQ